MKFCALLGLILELYIIVYDEETNGRKLLIEKTTISVPKIISTLRISP